MLALLLATALAQAPPPVTEEDLFRKAQVLMEQKEFFLAHAGFQAFVSRFPQSARATEAKRLEMESALQLAQTGHPKSFLGLEIFYTSSKGIELLRASLRNHPREAFSPTYIQKLGMFFYEQEDLDAAEAEFNTVVEEYEDSPVFVLALYMLGRVREQRFRGMDYELKPLRDAHRLYKRFMEEADRMRKLPAPAATWVDTYMESVKERLTAIEEAMAEKQLETAAYYESRGYPKAAVLYWRSIVKAHPLTKAAAEARKRLEAVTPADDPALKPEETPDP
jgi:outer membrane protein assembly factor BamD (BamD/ComL family)